MNNHFKVLNLECDYNANAIIANTKGVKHNV